MSWLHCCWGLGATLGPVILSVFLGGHNGWRFGYGAVAALQWCLVLALAATLRLWGRCEPRQPGEPGQAGRAHSFRLSPPPSNRRMGGHAQLFLLLRGGKYNPFVGRQLFCLCARLFHRGGGTGGLCVRAGHHGRALFVRLCLCPLVLFGAYFGRRCAGSAGGCRHGPAARKPGPGGALRGGAGVCARLPLHDARDAAPFWRNAFAGRHQPCRWRQPMWAMYACRRCSAWWRRRWACGCCPVFLLCGVAGYAACTTYLARWVRTRPEAPQ